MKHHATHPIPSSARRDRQTLVRLGAAVCGPLLALLPALAHAETATERGPDSAGPASEQTFALSAKGGVLASSEIYIDDVAVDSESGPLVVAKLDGFIVPRASLGLQGLIALPSIGDEGVTLLNAGATLKLHYEIGSARLRPGLALSYQRISSERFEPIQGFSPGAFVELGLAFSEQVTSLIEVGFLSQPNGGNEDSTVTFGPTWYLAFGVEFGS